MNCNNNMNNMNYVDNILVLTLEFIFYSCDAIIFVQTKWSVSVHENNCSRNVCKMFEDFFNMAYSYSSYYLNFEALYF